MTESARNEQKLRFSWQRSASGRSFFSSVMGFETWVTRIRDGHWEMTRLLGKDKPAAHIHGPTPIEVMLAAEIEIGREVDLLVETVMMLRHGDGGIRQ